MPKRIIGLTGHIGAGKSEVARMLSVQHCFIRFKFAYKLKAMLKVLGLTQMEIEGDLKEQPCALLGGRTPRHAMITLGTEWGRNLIDKDLWVTSAMMDLDLHQGNNSFVFDDVRFPNEAQAIRKRGGEIWRIVRHGEKTSTYFHESHESEAGQVRLLADEIIYNLGTLDELANEVACLIRRPS